MTIFFTADTHYGHYNVIKYSNRPFKDCIEMDSAMIEAWNSRVGSEDTVYHLGDFSFRRTEYTTDIIRALNGKIHLILGNHDRKMRPEIRKLFASVNYYADLTIDNQFIVMSHYPMVTWHGSSRNSWMLHGHCHGNLQANKTSSSKRMDVGVDTNTMYAPWSFEEVSEYMKNKEFNAEDHHESRI